MYIEILEELLKRLASAIEPTENSSYIKYMRFWAEYLEERFLNKTRKALSTLIHQQFPNVFLDASPEWLNRFLISGKKIYDVLLHVENFAKQKILARYDDAIKYIVKNVRWSVKIGRISLRSSASQRC